MSQGASTVFRAVLRCRGRFSRFLSSTSMVKASTTSNYPMFSDTHGGMASFLNSQRTSLGGSIIERNSIVEYPATGSRFENLHILSQPESKSLRLSPMVSPETFEASSTLKKRRRKMNRHKYRKRRKRDRRRSKA